MQKAIVLHADILGFRTLINEAEDDPEEKILKSFKKALREGINTINQFEPAEDGARTALSYKLFSDNLYVSFSYEEDNLTSFSDVFISCIAFARTYIINMMDSEIAIRGGVSFGSDYSDETMIFSMALVKAYELEMY